MVAQAKAENIGPLAWSHTSDAARVLALAFMDGPTLRFFFSGRGETYDRALNAFFRMLVAERITRRDPPLGLWHEGSLAGVAVLERPSRPAGAIGRFLTMRVMAYSLAPIWHAGLQGIGRMWGYANLISRYRPSGAHIYLTAIGIHPGHQSRGLGTQLLSSLHDLAHAHTTAAGVALDTDKESNVRLYQRQGYDLTGHAYLEDIETWFMFRPRRRHAQSGGA